MVSPFFFLPFIVCEVFYTTCLSFLSHFSDSCSSLPPPLHSIVLLLSCFSLFPRWISLLCCLLCFLVIFCSSFCFFFLRVFLIFRFYAWFLSLPSLFSLLCYSLDIKKVGLSDISNFLLSDSIFLLFSSVPVEEISPSFHSARSIQFVLILWPFTSEVGRELPEMGRGRVVRVLRCVLPPSKGSSLTLAVVCDTRTSSCR